MLSPSSQPRTSSKETSRRCCSCDIEEESSTTKSTSTAASLCTQRSPSTPHGASVPSTREASLQPASRRAMGSRRLTCARRSNRRAAPRHVQLTENTGLVPPVTLFQKRQVAKIHSPRTKKYVPTLRREVAGLPRQARPGLLVARDEPVAMVGAAATSGVGHARDHAGPPRLHGGARVTRRRELRAAGRVDLERDDERRAGRSVDAHDERAEISVERLDLVEIDIARRLEHPRVALRRARRVGRRAPEPQDVRLDDLERPLRDRDLAARDYREVLLPFRRAERDAALRP